ncbi:IclR family transcriptional regulator domain-containing protein [Acetobacter vaccinii]|uniref:Helix-turn-helix domain-containing protein n=1 Tax=Acetobacter vaccinii TaxID=2592655 RepID=A0A5C1YQW5_9PROT|nr:IclR family transcriptional regulator C-terminal domain-containing protein [Acetobacter vaccinii]QEO17968.1 helix-turn-helix domain-containing protein [Acetobacter vaccinii]
MKSEAKVARILTRDAEARKSNPVGRDFSEALARGLTILAAFDADHPAMTLSDLSRKVDLPRATVRRALLTLLHLGYVADEGRLFRLQPSVLRLAATYLSANPTSTLIQPVCERLAHTLNATCSVAVLDRTEAVMIAYAYPRRTQAFGVTENIGLRLPAYCSAVGRTLLANMAPEHLTTTLDGMVLEKITERTITDRTTLETLLSAIRQHQYALVDQEVEVGFRSIAVPLFRRDGTAIAALNVGIRREQASPQQMEQEYLPHLQQEADALRLQLL